MSASELEPSIESVKDNRGVITLESKCLRCGTNVAREKGATIALRKKTMFFCDTCFKSVFKYDENMRTVSQIWEQNGRKVPFVVRSSQWHRSSYMKVKDVKDAESGNGKTKKITFVGDMYLRGELKEQDRNIGKSNHYIWYSWSEELAQKYKEAPKPEVANPESDISA